MAGVTLPELVICVMVLAAVVVWGAWPPRGESETDRRLARLDVEIRRDALRRAELRSRAAARARARETRAAERRAS